LVAGLGVIEAQIYQNAFANEYEFEAALLRLIYSAHDGHLSLTAGILGVFSFGTEHSIVSVSSDGFELPKVFLSSKAHGHYSTSSLSDYISEDIVHSNGGASFEPSPISTIDGTPVTDYLTQFAALNSVGGLDGHADWNQLMNSPAQNIQSIVSK
jgi:hypothetical protein